MVDNGGKEGVVCVLIVVKHPPASSCVCRSLVFSLQHVAHHIVSLFTGS